jgi:hypothetical protein
MCPICGAKVADAVLPPKPVPAPAVDTAPLLKFARNGGAPKTAVLEAPVEPPKLQIAKVEPVKPLTSKVEPVCPVHVVKETPPMDVPAETRTPESRRFELLQGADPSAAELPPAKELPQSSKPLSGPLVLGAIAYVAVLLLPLTLAFESHKILGVLGFCMTGFFAPFAPIAWMVGMAVEKRRREQGLKPENRVTLGRLLGQWATLILVSEVTLALVSVAALRLSGKFPVSFWTSTF